MPSLGPRQARCHHPHSGSDPELGSRSVEHQIEIWCSRLLPCSARSTTRSTFYLALPAPTLTVGFPELRCLSRTTLG
jgi:hypothetical protein